MCYLNISCNRNQGRCLYYEGYEFVLKARNKSKAPFLEAEQLIQKKFCTKRRFVVLAECSSLCGHRFSVLATDLLCRFPQATWALLQLITFDVFF